MHVQEKQSWHLLALAGLIFLMYVVVRDYLMTTHFEEFFWLIDNL